LGLLKFIKSGLSPGDFDLINKESIPTFHTNLV